LGNIYDALGELNESESYHQKHLEVARKLGDKAGEWKAIMGLGNVAKNRGQWQQAATYYQQSLDILEKHPDAESPQGRAMLMGNLASILSRENPEESLHLATAALAIFRNLGNPYLIARALVLMGDIYNSLKQPESALKYHQQSLEIAEKCREVVAEIDAMKGIAEANLQLNNCPLAQKWYQKCRELIRIIIGPWDSIHWFAVLP
jgi:tetratricopeptide (TPR) repeat protein